jgi:hypothetical protein
VGLYDLLLPLACLAKAEDNLNKTTKKRALSGSCHTNPQSRALEKLPVDHLLKNSPTI